MYYTDDPEEIVTICLTRILIALIALVGIIIGATSIYKHYTTFPLFCNILLI